MKTEERRRIDAAFDKEAWGEARRLLVHALKAEPDNHWLVTRLATTFYEERDYMRALEWSEKGARLAPKCPLVLWDHACTLDMMNHEEDAIQIWRTLIARGVERIAHDECGEGTRWAESLINDCRYRVALSSFDLGRRAEAMRSLQEHLAHRRPGLPSIYSLKEVRENQRKMRATTGDRGIGLERSGRKSLIHSAGSA